METRRILFSGLLALFMAACSSDKDEPVLNPESPTPYELTLPKHLPQAYTIPIDNPLTVEGVELGRHLFYEKKLSGDNTMSCGSCHQQAKAFTDGRGLSLGIDGVATKRSAMSLANLLWFSQLNWDGSENSLESQARGPIESPIEMHESMAKAVEELQATILYPALFRKAFGDSIITETNILKALAQFERTLVSGSSRYDRYMQNQAQLTQDELEGMKLFLTHPDPSTNTRGGNCGDCHGGTLFTHRTFHNNGLDATFSDNGLGQVTAQDKDNGKFKAPTLRNISLTAPYMHDGRFGTLEEVLEHYRTGVVYSETLAKELMQPNGQPGLPITAAEQEKIILFLHTLTDKTFTQNNSLSSPH